MSKTRNSKISITSFANNFAISVITLGFLYACGGGGGGGGGDGGGYEPPATPAPTVSISADPTSVLLSGEPTSFLTEEEHLRVIQLLNNSCKLHVSTLHRLSAKSLFTNVFSLD